MSGVDGQEVAAGPPPLTVRGVPSDPNLRVLALGLATAPQAAAQPELPSPPPWVPLAPTGMQVLASTVTFGQPANPNGPAN